MESKRKARNWLIGLAVVVLVVFLLGYPFQFQPEHFSLRIALLYWLDKLACLFGISLYSRC